MTATATDAATATAPGWADALTPALRERLRPAAPFSGPLMLATLTDRRDFDDEWIFGRKLDGVRVVAVREEGGARLLSRGGQRLDGTYPELVEALAGQTAQGFTLDGEVVAMRGGRTDFALLQRRSGLHRWPLRSAGPRWRTRTWPRSAGRSRTRSGC